MKYFVFTFWIITTLIACKNSADESMVVKHTSLEGQYSGYRSQTIGNAKASDSTKITLEVTSISPNEIRIQQISPNEFQYLVTMRENHFTYNKGVGETPCGAVMISGEGHFKNNALTLLETSKCLNTQALSSPASYIRLRAKK